MTGEVRHEGLETAGPIPPDLDGRYFPSPTGVMLSRGAHGLGLYATRAFAAGEVIYGTDPYVIPADGRRYKALVDVDGTRELVEITDVHSVRYGDVRILDIPGCFMNHSCAPTTYSLDELLDDGTPTGAYKQVALGDLRPGDQITCDYVLFDWDCDGHQFTCACGSPDCYGDVMGFAGLPPVVQASLAPRASVDVIRLWKRALAEQSEDDRGSSS